MRNLIFVGGVSALALLAGASGAAVPTGLDANGHLAAVTTPAGKFAFTRLENGVQIVHDGITKNIIFYGPQTVRVNANTGKNYWTAPSIVVVDKPKAIAFDVQDKGGSLTIVSSKLTIVIDKTSGALTFKDATGRVYTSERSRAPEDIKPVSLSAHRPMK